MSKKPFTIPFYPMISEQEFKRARRDREFRRKLLISSLQNLIGLMATLRASPEADDPDLAAQLREGADLAVKLSDVIKRMPDPQAQPKNAAEAAQKVG